MSYRITITNEVTEKVECEMRDVTQWRVSQGADGRISITTGLDAPQLRPFEPVAVRTECRKCGKPLSGIAYECAINGGDSLCGGTFCHEVRS